MTAAILQGFLLALGLILPLGVQNTFVFLQGTHQRRWAGGVPVALTAAVCDTFLITLAVSGVSLVVLSVPWFQAALSWIGILFLLYMGWQTWRADPGDNPTVDQARFTVRRQVIYAASVSLLNPHAILDTVAVIGTTSLHYTDMATKLGFTLACIGVSWFWFFGLMTAGFAIGSAGPVVTVRRWLNRASAVIMWAVAAQLLVAVLR